MTQCVVVSGLLCVEMCPVWSWFGLYFSLNFLFSFFFDLHVGVNAVCSAGLLVC